MRIIIINGPNLNLLGTREPEIYGSETFENYFSQLQAQFPATDLHYYQSNQEGNIIDKIQETGFSFDGIILNAGGYSHTSIAIADAIGSVTTPVIEVHISNTFAREEFRHKDMLTAKCKGLIVGLGFKGYGLAVEYFLNTK
ncbi:MAG: type II 3-dehydroquinate dehydratase [Fimbriimonadaceae bacterium]|nr:type II 3-dehydroquinate dehydratase [Chitinophagales bacterium]